MLDENLPAFFLKPSSAGVAHYRSLDLSYQGSAPEPAYTLQYADPASPSPTHKNCYAAALFDAYNPDVLFAEVLARPGWTQPSLSAEEARKNGGVPPPPQPMMPREFVVQLYNPDQQVRVELREGKWGGSDQWTFSMPQDVFRTPSASKLDHGQSDPATLSVTPRINFAWRKEGKLSKDLTCFMTGRSTDTATTKKKSSRKDPDIAVALWRSMRELTIYEPNVSRIEMEDPKGLECVLLLSAVVIKDLYFSSRDHMREMFNISDAHKLSAGGRKLSNPKAASSSALLPHTTPNDAKRNSLPRLQTSPAGPSDTRPPPPLPDPRAQWELDAETARLKAHADAEAQAAARRQRERDQADEVERRRLQKMVEQEEREARRRQAEIDKETERLRKKYGVVPIPPQQQQQQPPPPPNSSRPRQNGPSSYPAPFPPTVNYGPMPPPQPPRPTLGSNGLYVQPSSSQVYMSGANPSASTASLSVPSRTAKKRSSFFGLRTVSDDAAGPSDPMQPQPQSQLMPPQTRRLAKKGSAMW